MKSDEMLKSWSEMSDEILSGMAGWRQQHSRATFREIEEEVDKRLSVLRARMLSDAAMRSAQAEWQEGGREAICPTCGTKLEKKGKKKRKLHTRGGLEVELEQDYWKFAFARSGHFKQKTFVFRQTGSPQSHRSGTFLLPFPLHLLPKQPHSPIFVREIGGMPAGQGACLALAAPFVKNAKVLRYSHAFLRVGV
jgi:hypothetical protein